MCISFISISTNIKLMSQRKTKTRKISPSDEELEREILAMLKSQDSVSPATAIGLYASYSRLKERKRDWMLSPMRISTRYEAMIKKRVISKISDDDRRYFALQTSR
jgi:hypothetical protein